MKFLIDMDVENLQALKDITDDGVRSIYFKWFLAKNDRQMIDAEGGFNPQSIKLHRYAVTNTGQQGTVDNTKDPMSETMFKLGVAQGLGFKTDKRDCRKSISICVAYGYVNGAIYNR